VIISIGVEVFLLIRDQSSWCCTDEVLPGQPFTSKDMRFRAASALVQSPHTSTTARQHAHNFLASEMLGGELSSMQRLTVGTVLVESQATLASVRELAEDALIQCLL
jgi:hypothetical protein